MERNFDFEKIEKRLPYTVPDGFFDRLEADVMREAGITTGKPACIRRRLWHKMTLAAASAAAAVAMCVVMNVETCGRQAYGYDDVEQAFSGLSNDDQAYILQVYQDDIFMNQ